MSQGKDAQRLINISMIVACAAGGIGILVMAVSYRNLTIGLVFLGVAAASSLTYLLLRCKSCGLGVTKEADGSRTEPGTWPRANPVCKKCGANIP